MIKTSMLDTLKNKYFSLPSVLFQKALLHLQY